MKVFFFFRISFAPFQGKTWYQISALSWHLKTVPRNIPSFLHDIRQFPTTTHDNQTLKILAYQAFFLPHTPTCYLLFGTRCGARTRKPVKARDFKSLAYTSFATRALPFSLSIRALVDKKNVPPGNAPRRLPRHYLRAAFSLNADPLAKPGQSPYGRKNKNQEFPCLFVIL